MRNMNYDGVVLRARMFLDDHCSRSKINQLLGRIILLQYSARYRPDSQETIHAYQDLLSYYITPQVYSSNTNSAVSLTDDQRLIRDQALLEFWDTCGSFASRKLDFLRQQHELQNDPKILNRYRRRGETYPVVGIR
jgi:hypothetical protein